MRKFLLVIVLIIGLNADAYAQTSDEIAQEVTHQLQESGSITEEDASVVESSVKTLIDSGATKEEAKNIVAQAVHEAQAQGLKGKALSAKVLEVVRARKAQFEAKRKEARKREKEVRQQRIREEKRLRKENKK
ncbi:MAG: hypothetical protein NC817_00745 [Candidatus Omnitrophica bacterium]|nr:hypothetical protein [Candidatus Omnitrophota bacterium]MCM8823201.1 hypothetical protein [Candidatus Omnitrophota bacterium]MCM8826525.1 hypothetical protein [Candidatus Omnitrophota bacterium]